MKSTYRYICALILLYSCACLGSQKPWVRDDDSDSSGESRPLFEGRSSASSIPGDITAGFELQQGYQADDENAQPLVASSSARPAKEATLQYWARKSIAPIGAVASAISNLFTPSRPDLAVLMQSSKSGMEKQHALDDYLDTCIGKGDIEGLHIALTYVKENTEQVVILPQLKDKLITTFADQVKLEYWRLGKTTTNWQEAQNTLNSGYSAQIDQLNQKIARLQGAISFIDPGLTLEMVPITGLTQSEQQ